MQLTTFLSPAIKEKALLYMVLQQRKKVGKLRGRKSTKIRVTKLSTLSFLHHVMARLFATLVTIQMKPLQQYSHMLLFINIM